MQWVTSPVIVRMCPTMPQQARHACAEAIKWWAGKGVDYLVFEVGEVTRTPERGVIQIPHEEPPNGSAGYTQLHHAASGLIDAAEMRVSCHWYRAQTLSHELGHSLGLNHDPRPGNLMYAGTFPGKSGLDAAQLAIVLP